MRIDELKSPYRELAEMRRQQKPSDTCNETFGFEWDATKEGHIWWMMLNEGKNPEIPQSSLDELKEYQNPTKDEKLFTAAVAAMQGMLSNEKLLKDMQFDRQCSEKAPTLESIAWNYAEALITEGKQRGHL